MDDPKVITQTQATLGVNSMRLNWRVGDE